MMVKEYWDVLALFLIPIGGGIPAGVLLAQSRKIDWQVMTFLYLISDIILALVFEPVLILFIKYGQKNPKLIRFSEILQQAILKTLEYYGNAKGIFPLIMIAFGLDPMSGRTVAVAAGHGFVLGWMIAITGDMLYFTMIMASTLWLNSIIGDGTTTMIIIFGLMLIGPALFRKIKSKF